MTTQERESMKKQIKREKAYFESLVSDEFKALVKKGMALNAEALKKLARS